MMASIHIDKFDSDQCNVSGEHDFDNEAVLFFITRKGVERKINQDHYIKQKRIHQRMKIIGGCVRCSKCKILYKEAHNPFFI